MTPNKTNTNELICSNIIRGRCRESYLRKGTEPRKVTLERMLGTGLPKEGTLLRDLNERKVKVRRKGNKLREQPRPVRWGSVRLL